ncbi:MAG: hypothetical protein RR346_06100, partial [Bacteroidales bacterium]
MIQAFEGVDRNDRTKFKDILKIGAGMAGIAWIDSDEKEIYRIAGDTEYVIPVTTHQLEISKHFTDYGLSVLGCDVKQKYEKYTDALGNELTRVVTDTDGNPVKTYSFGKNFLPEHLSRDFNLYQLDSITYPPAEGQPSSRKLKATDDFPIFALIYEYNGAKWGKIYQPCGPEQFRFTYFGEHPELKDHLFGDNLMLTAIANLKDSTLLEPYLSKMGNAGKERMSVENDGTSRRVKRVILCSGLTDSINTYYKGGVNVLFLNSESSDLNHFMFRRIENASREQFILYDMDATGRKNANRHALRYPVLKVVNLPDDLSKIISSKGKPSKDAKDYFTLYESRMLAEQHESIEYHFRHLLNTSKPLKFWTKTIEYEKDEVTIKKVKYDINSSSFLPFINAMGVWRYQDPETEEWMFVYVQDNIVQVIQEKQIQSFCNDLMKRYITNSRYYEVAIENVIHTSAKVKRDNLNNIPSVDLNLDSWGADFDYLYFKNGALRITPDGLKMQDYKSMPYQIFKKSIKPNNFAIAEETFRIVPNEEYQSLKTMIAQEQEKPNPDTANIDEWTKRYRMLHDLAQYRIEWLVPMEKQPVIVQFLYDTGRMYWRKEEEGQQLTEAEQLEHDAHFISKVNAIGYSLYRERSKTRPWMLYGMENRVRQEGKSDGGSGKSLIFNLLGKVRPMATIPGKTFNPANGAVNFCNVIPRETALTHIEDLDVKIPMESLYNLADASLQVKRLYKDVVEVPFRYIPVTVLTSNFPVDLSNGSTMRRIYPVAVSDYYHPSDIGGTVTERKPSDKFGEIMGESASQKEQNEFFSFMARCISFFMREKKRINPPMAGVRYRSLIRDIGAERYNFFAQFFSDPRHLNCYHSYNNLLVQYRATLTLSEEYSEKISPKTLREGLVKYCAYNGLTFNPPGVFRTDGDRVANRIRVTVWDTVPIMD